MIEGFKTVLLFVYSVLGGLAVLLGFPLIKRLWKLAFRKRPKTHGDAHWATKREIKKAGLFNDHGMIIGQHKGKLLRLPKPAHVLNYGRTGSGKTRAFMVPNLRALTQHNMLVVDPKGGELVRLTAEQRRSSGGQVMVINPLEASTSARFNVIDYAKEAGRYEIGGAMGVIAALVVPTGRPGTPEEHFSTFAQKLIAGAIAYRLATEPDSATLPDILASLTTRGQPHLQQLFRNMAHFDKHPVISAAVQAFNSAGDREKGSFQTTLANRCLPFMDEGVREVLSGSSFSWKEVFNGENPTTVYLNFPIEMQQMYGPFVRMMVGICTASAQREFRLRGSKPLERPFAIMVDEAASMGNCEAVQNGITFLRGSNVSVAMAFQSPSQVEQLYNDAATLQNSCETWIISGGERNRSIRNELSEIIGDTTIDNPSKSKGKHGESEGASETARRLLKPGELRQIPNEEEVVIYENLNIRCKKAFDFS